MMKSGTYYVGDLCYVMRDSWDEVCSLLFAGRDDHGCNQGEFALKDGTRFAIYNTKYGDGVYYDQNDRSYAVDSGSIGCILLEEVDQTHPDCDIGSGQTITFDEDFYTGVLDGKIMFNKVSVDTDPDFDGDQ